MQEENRVLKARLGVEHLRFTNAERCRLARKAHALGRKLLSELDTLVTPKDAFRGIITRVGTDVVRLPPRSHGLIERPHFRDPLSEVFWERGAIHESQYAAHAFLAAIPLRPRTPIDPVEYAREQLRSASLPYRATSYVCHRR